jgi:hypothetical protein
MAAKAGASLPEDVASAEVFLAGIAMAGVTVPELRENEPLRRKWQEFCLSLETDTGRLGSEGASPTASG